MVLALILLGLTIELILTNSSRTYVLIDQSKSWTEARDYCAALGSSLATVITDGDHENMKAAMNETGIDIVWTGLNDRVSEGIWVWSDATPCENDGNDCINGDDDDPPQWGDNQPDNYAGEDCAWLRIYDAGEHEDNRTIWYNDAGCESEREFACNSYSPSPPREYIVINEEKTWTEAQSYCLSLGTVLATAITDGDYANLKAAMNETGVDNLWTGLNDRNVGLNNNEGDWVWDDGTPCQNDDGDCINGDEDESPQWGTDEPNDLNGEDCGELRIYDIGEGEDNRTIWYNDADCGENFAFACNEPLYHAGSTTMSWSEAKEYCLALGSDLASIHSVIEHMAARAACRQRGGSCWIGLNDTHQEGHWEWTDGSPTDYGFNNVDGSEPTKEFPWDNGEPNSFHSGEDCIQMRLSDDWDWNDATCSSDLYPLCDADIPTSPPTMDPTIDPTVDPTSNPTTEPTLDPTIDPTADPTVQVCSEEDIGTFSWDELTEDASNAPRFNVTQFDVNEEDLSLIIEVELEYLGKVTADYQSEANYGVTYVLDFESYNAHKDAIYEPGSCQNRDGASFNDSSLKFEDYWTYSDQPLWGNVGTNEFLAYPPPGDDWTVSMKDSDKCGTIVYQGHFTWNELTSCQSFGGDKYITTIDDTENNEIRLEGVFYINVVSPFAASSDLGYYRVYQLLSQPFVISVSKTVYVLGSTGINVLTMSVIAVYKEDNSNTFKLMILTEAQNYLELTRTSSGVYLFEPSGSGNNLIETGEFIAPSDAEEGCLNNKQFLCSQIWEIRAENVNCNGNEKGIDFSGDYTLQFMPKCRNESIIGADLSAYCQEWLGNHSDIADGVDLETSLSWKDEVCDPQLFTVQFQASMNFYVDGYDNPAPSDQLYQVGEDTIYIEIDTSFPSDTYNVFDTELVNVWICTFPPNEGPSIPIEAGLAEGGCFSDNRDGGNATSDNPYFYHIYSVDGPIEEEGFNLIGHPDDSLESKDELQFSFIVPDKIARDTLYIHAQIEVELSDQSDEEEEEEEEEGEEGEQRKKFPARRRRRRRLLTTASGSGSIANQMDHFLGNIGINRNHKNNKYKPNPNPNPNYSPPQQIPFQSPSLGTTTTTGTWSFNLSSPWVIGIGSILGLLLFGNILFLCYVNCLNKQQRARVSFDHRRRSGYESVNKQIDSEDFNDSEAHLIIDSEPEKDDE